MRAYETFDHGADIGIRGYGKSVEEAFENAAKAMFSVMVEIDEVKPVDREDISCESLDLETLFVEWLNSLISTSHLREMLFCNFKVEIGANKLKGSAWGEKLDRNRHHIMTEAKAATYSMLRVERKDNQYIAQCVVDV